MKLILRTIIPTTVSLFCSPVESIACDDSTRNLILENLPKHTFFSVQKKLHTTISSNEDETIDLSDEGLKGEEVKNLVEHIIIDPQRHKIHHINLSKNPLSDVDAISLASTLDFLDSLKILDIRNTEIGIMGLQAILLKMEIHKNNPILLCSTEGFKIENIQIKGFFSRHIASSEYELSFKGTHE